MEGAPKAREQLHAEKAKPHSIQYSAPPEHTRVMKAPTVGIIYCIQFTVRYKYM